MRKELVRSLRFFLIVFILCGGIYTLVVTGIGQLAFSNKANGSLIENEKVIGSKLVAQEFNEDKYFNTRPSGVSNLSPYNNDFRNDVESRTLNIQKQNNSNKEVPVDLITQSASGIDPHISVEGAMYQVDRISKTRNINKSEVEKLISEETYVDFLTGNKYVNVLEINILLDNLSR